MSRLLVLLSGLLIAVIAMELAHSRSGDDHPQPEVIPVERVATPVARPTGQVKGSRDQWASTLLARPLFAPDRKPVGDSPAASIGLPRLAGIIASADGAVAIFQPAGSVKAVVARHGDTVAGWEVTTVALDTVTLRKANDRIVLKPRFNGVETTAGAAEPKQPRPRWEVAAPTGLLRARWSNPQLQP
jgi:general secretion pathway protein N